MLNTETIPSKTKNIIDSMIKNKLKNNAYLSNEEEAIYVAGHLAKNGLIVTTDTKSINQWIVKVVSRNKFKWV